MTYAKIMTNCVKILRRGLHVTNNIRGAITIDTALAATPRKKQKVNVPGLHHGRDMDRPLNDFQIPMLTEGERWEYDGRAFCATENQAYSKTSGTRDLLIVNTHFLSEYKYYIENVDYLVSKGIDVDSSITQFKKGIVRDALRGYVDKLHFIYAYEESKAS